MDTITWCKEQTKGIRIIQPNKRMTQSYLAMAQDSIQESTHTTSILWLSAISYYIYYYSLYALMQRIGVKCEIHSCSLEFMKECLKKIYSEQDCKDIHEAFTTRNRTQYYPQEQIVKGTVTAINKKAKLFFIKTKETITTITENDIQSIREDLQQHTS